MSGKSKKLDALKANGPDPAQLIQCRDGKAHAANGAQQTRAGPGNAAWLDQVVEMVSSSSSMDAGFLSELELAGLEEETPEAGREPAATGGSAETAPHQAVEDLAPTRAPPVLGRVETVEHQRAVELAVAEFLPARPVRGPEPLSHEEVVEDLPTTRRVDLSATQEGGSGSRGLTDEEIAHARRVYGDSIDYDAVRITRDHWLSTGAPKTIGNTMHMWGEAHGSNLFSESGEMNAYGVQKLLIHEIGHVWQYQNGGRAYITEALWSQLKAVIGRGHGGHAYHWQEAHVEGLAWEDWNPEQQAQAAEDYFNALQRLDRDEGNTEAAEIVALLEPYMDAFRAGEGAVETSTAGAVAGASAGATTGAAIGSLGGPLGTLVGAGLGALLGGLFGRGG